MKSLLSLSLVLLVHTVTLAADALIFDLEDAVAPEAKPQARAQVAAAVKAAVIATGEEISASARSRRLRR